MKLMMPRDVTSFLLTPRTGELEYEIQVRAINNAGEGPFAGPVNVTVPVPPTATPVPPTVTATPTDHPVIIVEEAPTATLSDPGQPGQPPSAPRNLLLTPGDGKIDVSWSAPSDEGDPPFTDYKIHVRVRRNSGWNPTTTKILVRRSTTSLLLTPQTGELEYEIQVRAVNNAGEGPSVGPEKVTVPVPPTATPVPPTATATSTPTPTPTPSGPDRPPSAPRNLQLTPGDRKIEVSWDEPEDLGKPAIDRYYVEYRKVGAPNWLYVGQFHGTSATIAGLQNGVEYEVQVFVANSRGWMAFAGPKRATPNLPTATPSGPDRPPSAPRNLQLTPGDKRIEVSWDEPEDLGKPEMDGYLVEYRRVGADMWVRAGQFHGTSATIANERLRNGEEYEVRVKVSNIHGEAIAGPMRVTPVAPTATATFTPTPTPTPSEQGRPPSAPRNLQLTPGDRKIEVSWDEPEDLGDPEIDTYYVAYRKVGATKWMNVGRTNTSVTLKGLENGVEYEVQVFVSNSHGRAISGPKRATPNPPTATPVPPTATATATPTATATSTPIPTPTPSEPGRLPSAPRNLLLTPGDRKIEVSWSAPTDEGDPPFNGYEVHVRVRSDLGWAPMKYGIGRNKTTLSQTLQTGALEYEIQVRAVNDAGNGPFAGPVNFTVPVPPTATPVPPTATATATPTPTPTPGRLPSAPRDLQVTQRDGKIYVSWSAPADEGDPPFNGYEVHVRVRSDSGWAPMKYGIGRNKTTLSLTPRTGELEFEIQVRAVNNVGGKGPFAGPEKVTVPVPPTATATATPTPTAATPSGLDRPPSAPRNLQLTPGDKRIEVSWDEPEDLGKPAIDRYYVEYRRVGADMWVSAGPFYSTSATIASERLENGAEYEVRVKVFNIHGEAIAGPIQVTPGGTDSGGGH